MPVDLGLMITKACMEHSFCGSGLTPERDYRIATEPRKNRENADVILIIMHDALDQPWGQHSPAWDCAYIALLRLRFHFRPNPGHGTDSRDVPHFRFLMRQTLFPRLLKL